MIVLTGSTGNTGSLAAKDLKAAGVEFRCMARRPEALEQLVSAGYEAVHGDYDDIDSLKLALQGARAAYLVCTPDQNMERRERAFIDAAAEAGIEHLVKLSAFEASSDGPTPNLQAHGRVEEHLRRSGISHTILRPHGFMQTTYSMSIGPLHERGLFVYPAGEGKTPAVDVRDVAAAVVKVLADGAGEKAHENRVYELTGPEALSFSEMAAILAEEMQREITYVDVPEPELAATMKAVGVPEGAVAHVIGVFRLIREGALARTTNDLKLLGVTPRTFRDFARDIASGLTGAAVSFQPPAPPPGG